MREAVREIPLSRPWLDKREEELVLEVLRSGRLSLGPWIDRFEEEVAARVGAPYAAALSSGTAGLHLLSRIAGLGAGDEVITSPLSFVASANCFVVEGATPVFADVDPVTLNLDPAAVEAAVTERTRAIVAVDMFGFPCELEELRAVAERHGLALIEDACESLGAEYRGRPLGAHGPSAILELRSAAASRYRELLADVDGVEPPAPDDDAHRRSWFVYVVKLDGSLDRAAVMDALRREGVATAEYVPCIHLQPYMRERFGFGEGLCPVAEQTASRTLALPFFTQIDPGDQERVVEVLRGAIAA